MAKEDSMPLLFEIAWEVANKVGGIYTVLKSKAPVTANEYGDRYCLIGPLSHKSAHLEVEAIVPDSAAVRGAIKAMNAAGVKTLYGRWLIDGSPLVLLLDVQSQMHRLDEWKQDLWNIASIPSPPHDTETNDAIVFGYLTAWFLGELVQQHRRASSSQQQKRAGANNQRIIAHVHEWLAGVCLPLIKCRGIDVATIFTTHATLLGRYLCAGSVDFYNNLAHFDVDYEAGKRQIYHRYCIERAATHSADVFTTVSHITAYESEHLLKRKPDGVLPNGLNVVKFSAIHEFQNLHAHNKEKINQFVRGHFYGHYDFDLENTVYFFTAGRYEYRNKGVDMFVESLARLNHRLKSSNSKMTVVAFIIMPASTHSFTVEALKGQAVLKQLKDTVSEIQTRVGHKIFEAASRGQLPQTAGLLSDEDLIPLKRRIFSLRRDTLPPIVTHNMADDSNDPILNQLRRVSLFNSSSDRVKVVFHPEFLNQNNPLFGLDYEDFVRGCHLGVFPSYYEPWGYTPAECTVMGVPSISTNLSGFGCYMEEMIETPSDYGIYVVDRRMKSVEESLEQLVDQMEAFCSKSRRQRINQRNRTERLSDILDWKRMGQEYVKARHLALHRKYPADSLKTHNNNNNSDASVAAAAAAAGDDDKIVDVENAEVVGGDDKKELNESSANAKKEVSVKPAIVSPVPAKVASSSASTSATATTKTLPLHHNHYHKIARPLSVANSPMVKPTVAANSHSDLINKNSGEEEEKEDEDEEAVIDGSADPSIEASADSLSGLNLGDSAAAVSAMMPKSPIHRAGGLAY